MSNALAIAAVTATLKSLLSKVTDPLPGEPVPDPGDLSDALVSVKPPDKARDPQEANSQLNLFLFQTALNPAFRNYPMPGSGPDGENRPSPLALDLYYVISAYGRGGDDQLAHHLMGRAMSILHRHAELDRITIRDALAGNDLYRQIERVRLLPHNLSIEELSKLWTIFQTGYRLSAAYHVAVLLIDAPVPSITPLPVLQRGPITVFGTDTGAKVTPSLEPPTPTLHGLTLPASQPSARLGDVLSLSGARLAGATVRAELRHARMPATHVLTIPAAQVSATALGVQLPTGPAAQAAWPAGPWSLFVHVDGRPSNPVYFTLAPRVALTSSPSGADLQVGTSITPQVWPGQRVSLLFGDREIPAPDFTSRTATLTFLVDQPGTGLHTLRLRVDGVDSLVVVDYTADVPAFDPSQQITV